MIDFLLQNGADLCIQDVNGSTPVHIAVYKKDYSIVKRMFSYYTETMKNSVDNKGLSHLHAACLANRADIVKNILDSGSFVDMATSIGETPLHFAVKFNCIEIVEVLLERNADFTLQETYTGSTPLHFAIQKQYKEIIIMILSVHNRKIINPVNNFGLSHFHILCMKNESILINQFLQNKIGTEDQVKLDSPIYPGFRPLHFAVKNGHIESTKILLNSNFDIITKDIFNKVPLHYIGKLHPNESKQILDAFWLVIQNKDTQLAEKTGLTALHVACMRDDILAVKNLLHKDVDINAHASLQCPIYSGCSPLYLAVKYNKIRIIKMLLCYGANVNSEDKYGFTPLHIACSNAKIKAIEILLTYNADPSVKSARQITPLRLALQSNNEKIIQIILSHPTSKRNNPMDNKGLTYFHIVCLRGMIETARDYIHCGVNLDEPVHPFAQKYSGYTPLHIAVYKKNRQMVDLILGHWTKINTRNREGATALHLTCIPRAGYADIAAKLLLYGADPDVRNNLGFTLVELAIKYNKTNILDVAFKYKASPNLMSPMIMNYRPLELAIAWQREKIVGVLLKNGASVHFTSLEGGTLIHQTIQLVQAKEHYYARIFTQLMEHGCDLNTTDCSGRTALHHAYWPVNLAALKALLRCGANIDVEDRSGRTIVSYFFEISTSRMPRLELYEIFCKHLQVRKLAGFPISHTNELLYERLLKENENNLDDEEEHDEKNTLANACKMELERMKSTYFGYVSLYEMFRNVNKMATHLARNGAFARLIKSNQLAQLFPECGCLVMMQYGKALARKDLLEPALEALDALIIESFDEICWNLDCSDAVIDYLNNTDLCSLAAAVRAD
ncbi:ankyrin-2-like isoform X2 [Phymastichus coffea]|nr:ankyrin-2-like isoform X2 [Phymastichus coffea]